MWFWEESKCTAVPVCNVKKCKMAVTNDQTLKALLIYFAKAFGYLPNKLMISKLTSSGCSLNRKNNE